MQGEGRRCRAEGAEEGRQAGARSTDSPGWWRSSRPRRSARPCRAGRGAGRLRGRRPEVARAGRRPAARGRSRTLAEAARPRVRPPLVVGRAPPRGRAGGRAGRERPAAAFSSRSPASRPGSAGTAGSSPRTSRGSSPPSPNARPGSTRLLEASPEARLDRAYRPGPDLKFVEVEDDDKATWLRLAAKGRTWLAAGFEEQYARVYEYYRATREDRSLTYYDELDDELWPRLLDRRLEVPRHPALGGTRLEAGEPRAITRYYDDMKPEHRKALRQRDLEGLRGVAGRRLPPLGQRARPPGLRRAQPADRGRGPAKMTIYLDRRQVARLPERSEQAGKLAARRLPPAPPPAVRRRPAAVDAEGKLCVARLPRLDGYFGRPYKADDEAGSAEDPGDRPARLQRRGDRPRPRPRPPSWPRSASGPAATPARGR